MIVFLGNSGNLDNASPAEVWGFSIILLGLMAMFSPVMYSGIWLMLMLLGLPVDWMAGFRVFILVAIASGVYACLHHYSIHKKEQTALAEWKEKMQKTLK